MSAPRVRWSLQLRLTLFYGGLFLATGAMLLTITYLLVSNSRFMGNPTPPAVSQPTLIGDDVVRVPAPTFDSDLGTQLAAQRERDLQRLLAADGIALGVMTVVSVGLGWLVARRALRPLRSMAGTARMISERNLHKRLAVKGPHDEVKELADTFDGLLGRLEGTFEAQRRFVANASHELRTPLTVERSLLEVALADPDATAEELRHTCERVLVNNKHQGRLIEALLTLARSQRGLDQRTPLELSEVVGEVLDGRDQVAVGPRVKTELHLAHTEGDRSLMERLAINLIDNAFRHNMPDGWVRVWTGRHLDRPALRIVNSGPEIRPEEIDVLFQPFRRLDTARTTTDAPDGLGIGLSIVEAIATAHGATVEASPVPGGGLDVLIQFQPVAGAGDQIRRHHPAAVRGGGRRHVAPVVQGPAGRARAELPAGTVNHRAAERSQ